MTVLAMPSLQANHPPRQEPKCVGHLIYDKGGKNILYNGKKTVSSVSGAGKTGQLHVNE